MAAQRLSAGAAVRQAILADVLNPKSALFFLAFLPQFVRAENGPVWLQLSVLGTLFVVMGLLRTVIVAISAGTVGGFFASQPGCVALARQGGWRGL